MANDPICNICGERKSAHVATEQGPFTHPREARGEGHYELQFYWEGFDFNAGQWDRWEKYKFVPKEAADGPVRV